MKETCAIKKEVIATVHEKPDLILAVDTALGYCAREIPRNFLLVWVRQGKLWKNNRLYREWMYQILCKFLQGHKHII